VGLAEEATALRPELKVLFTTGYSESVVQRTAVFGEAAILAKPYKPAQLKQMIHQAIATNAAPKE
jgi:CheY-like chemotaxis protein